MKKQKPSLRWAIFRKEGRLTKRNLRTVFKQAGIKMNTKYILGGM